MSDLYKGRGTLIVPEDVRLKYEMEHLSKEHPVSATYLMAVGVLNVKRQEWQKKFKDRQVASITFEGRTEVRILDSRAVSLLHAFLTRYGKCQVIIGTDGELVTKPKETVEEAKEAELNQLVKLDPKALLKRIKD